MHQLTGLFLGLFLLLIGCAQPPKEPVMTLVNAAGLDKELMSRLEAFAEKELHVDFRTLENARLSKVVDFQAVESVAARVKTDTDVALIVLSGDEADERHLVVNAEAGLALINTTALYVDDDEIFGKRLERMVMRAAAFVFEMPPTPDPYCVTRDYKTVEELDRMGRNYSPPWMSRFADEAKKRGLKPMLRTGDRQGLPGSLD